MNRECTASTLAPTTDRRRRDARLCSDVEVMLLTLPPPPRSPSSSELGVLREAPGWMVRNSHGSLGIRYPILWWVRLRGGSIGACFAAEHPGTVSKLALLSRLFDDFEGSGGAAALLFKVPLVGELVLQLVPDSKIADLSGKVLSADKRTALEREAAEQYRFRGKRRASWPIGEAAHWMRRPPATKTSGNRAFQRCSHGGPWTRAFLGIQ